MVLEELYEWCAAVVFIQELCSIQLAGISPDLSSTAAQAQVQNW